MGKKKKRKKKVMITIGNLPNVCMHARETQFLDSEQEAIFLFTGKPRGEKGWSFTLMSSTHSQPVALLSLC